MKNKPRYKLKSMDEYVYTDDEYEIIKKGGEITGTIDSPYALMHIALGGLESDEMPQLFHKDDFVQIVDNWINKLQKIKENY